MSEPGPHAQAMLDLMIRPEGHPEACVALIVKDRETLHEVRLLGELWIRSSDQTTRQLGADLLGVLGVM